MSETKDEKSYWLWSGPAGKAENVGLVRFEPRERHLHDGLVYVSRPEEPAGLEIFDDLVCVAELAER